MFLKKWSEERLLNRLIISTIDIGDKAEKISDKFYVPGFELDNGFRISIENNTTLHGFNDYSDLIGLKLVKIEFNIKDKFIKFIFEKDKFIEVDMSDYGFNGPEAIIIQKDDEIMVINDIEE